MYTNQENVYFFYSCSFRLKILKELSNFSDAKDYFRLYSMKVSYYMICIRFNSTTIMSYSCKESKISLRK